MMKKTVLWAVALLCTLSLFGCSFQKKPEDAPEDHTVHVINTFVKTPEAEQTMQKEVIWSTYEELSDNSWQCNGMPYEYKLEVSGTTDATEPGMTYTILSNRYPISFEQAFKEHALSRAGDKFFDLEDAVIVETRPSGEEMPEIQCVLQEKEGFFQPEDYNGDFFWARHKLGNTIEVHYENKSDGPAVVTLYRYNRIAAQKELQKMEVPPHETGVCTYSVDGADHGAYSIAITKEKEQTLSGDLHIYQVEERYR